ncbi:unnamed protein product [Dicrocoelium dendriticum]|nr:unnamed protein product [Dicrocoelium dendriticum]
MDPFVDVFLAVDEDHNGEITVEELEHYASANHLDKTMVQTWNALFDPMQNGSITLPMFCEKLGLKPEEVISIREERLSKAATILPSDVRVISADMSLVDQVMIINEIRRNFKEVSSSQELPNLAKRIKVFLDGHFGLSWQVLIAVGSYWATYTYLCGTSIQLFMNDYSYLIWRVEE